MLSGTRWKGEDAEKSALAQPISALYTQMQAWEPVEALLYETGALLHASLEQACVLERASFGVPLSPATTDSVCREVCEDSSEISEKGLSKTQMFQLMLEETFFLNYHLRCIKICRQSAKGRTYLTDDEFWAFLLKSKREFPKYCKAYCHLRSNNWVVRAGIQYGADYMAYRHHPAIVHSDYAVVVMAEEIERQRMNTWTEVHAMSRLCGSVAKTLLLLYVMTSHLPANEVSSACLENMYVKAVEIQRWLPEKHREENSSTTESDFPADVAHDTLTTEAVIEPLSDLSLNSSHEHDVSSPESADHDIPESAASTDEF